MVRSKILTYLVCVVTAVLCFSFEGKAQRFAVSTDLLHWAALSPGVELDMVMSPHSSMTFAASSCPANIGKGFSLAHVTVNPEYKYWFSMPFYRSYVGGDLMYTAYEADRETGNTSGSLVSLCASYGYSHIINKRWNIVPHGGLGVGVNFDDKTRFVPFIFRIGVNIQFVSY